MPEEAKNSVYPAGAKDIAPAEIIESLKRWNALPNPNEATESGLLIFGLGKTGEDNIHHFSQRCWFYPGGFNWENTRTIIALAEDRPVVPAVYRQVEQREYFYFGDPRGANKRLSVQGNPRVEQEFDRLKTYLRGQWNPLSVTTNRDIRCVITGSLAEIEIGLLDAVINFLARETGVKFIDHSLFLSLNSSNAKLLKEPQYATMREISHYLQTGVHIEGSKAVRLLERVYLTGNYDNQPVTPRIVEHSIAEAMFTLLNASSGIRTRRLEGGIYALGIRTLALSLPELADYFAWRLVAEFINSGRTLYPPRPLDQEEKNGVVQKFQAGYYQDQLRDWVGADLATFIKKPDARALPQQVDESAIRYQLPHKLTNFIVDANRADRK